MSPRVNSGDVYAEAVLRNTARFHSPYYPGGWRGAWPSYPDMDDNALLPERPFLSAEDLKLLNDVEEW